MLFYVSGSAGNPEGEPPRDPGNLLSLAFGLIWFSFTYILIQFSCFLFTVDEKVLIKLKELSFDFFFISEIQASVQ